MPKFQRDYSWEKEQWDIQHIVDGEEYHYMGYIVIKESDKTLTIVDGQQRLTTISLLVLAAIQKLRDIQTDKDKNRAEELLRNFIGTKDEVYLRTENKLTLNRNNDYYYRKAVEGEEIPKRGQKKSVDLMRGALEYFKEIFRTYNNGKDIAKIVQQVVDKFLFTTIYLGDDLNAYKIFETLNARGVQLSSGDLLKNHIFSLMDDKGDMPNEVADDLEEQWEAIGTAIEKTGYTDYMLHQWNSSHKLVRKHALFKNIQKEVASKEKAKNYLSTLEKQSTLYEAILNPDSDFWKDHADYLHIKKDLHVLKLFNIRRPVSVLLISLVKHEKSFAKIVQWIKIFSLRYNVICQHHPNEQEILYNKMCLEINGDCALEKIKSMIHELYPNDEKFAQAFAEKHMPTKQSNKKVRYLLARLSEHRDKGKTIDEENVTVEHILPSKTQRRLGTRIWAKLERVQHSNRQHGSRAFYAKQKTCTASL